MLLDSKSAGKCSSFARLGKRHLCCKMEEDEDNPFNAEFKRSLVTSVFGDDEGSEAIESIDCLRIACKVPYGHVRKTTSIQISIFQKELDDVHVE